MFWRKPPQNTVNTTIKYPCFLHHRHTSCYWYIDTVYHRCKIHPFLWLYRRLSTLCGLQMQVPLLVLCKPHREVKIYHKILLILGVYDSFYSSYTCFFALIPAFQSRFHHKFTVNASVLEGFLEPQSLHEVPFYLALQKATMSKLKNRFWLIQCEFQEF